MNATQFARRLNSTVKNVQAKAVAKDIVEVEIKGTQGYQLTVADLISDMRSVAEVEFKAAGTLKVKLQKSASAIIWPASDPLDAFKK